MINPPELIAARERARRAIHEQLVREWADPTESCLRAYARGCHAALTFKPADNLEGISSPLACGRRNPYPIGSDEAPWFNSGWMAYDPSRPD